MFVIYHVDILLSKLINVTSVAIGRNMKNLQVILSIQSIRYILVFEIISCYIMRWDYKENLLLSDNIERCIRKKC